MAPGPGSGTLGRIRNHGRKHYRPFAGNYRLGRSAVETNGASAPPVGTGGALVVGGAAQALTEMPSPSATRRPYSSSHWLKCQTIFSWMCLSHWDRLVTRLRISSSRSHSAISR